MDQCEYKYDKNTRVTFCSPSVPVHWVIFELSRFSTKIFLLARNSIDRVKYFRLPLCVAICSDRFLIRSNVDRFPQTFAVRLIENLIWRDFCNVLLKHFLHFWLSDLSLALRINVLTGHEVCTVKNLRNTRHYFAVEFLVVKILQL